MGGKTWSREEERFFWQVIVPQSPKAVRPADRSRDWKSCAQIMQREMGDKARRKYSKLMLFEHYFQNVQTGHKSPCAHEFVLEHKRELEMAQQRVVRSLSASTVASETSRESNSETVVSSEREINRLVAPCEALLPTSGWQSVNSNGRRPQHSGSM